METVKYCILGAGPAGVSFANQLKLLGEDNFIVVEKEDVAGGLCRSAIVDGSPLDIGGGHFLDVRRPKVCVFVFSFMPQDEWVLYDRDSRIKLGEKLIHHPLEANIWELPKELQVEYLKSIAIAGCNLGTQKPEKFVDWIYWKLGIRIAEDYMIPYNTKMFGNNLDELGTYWLEKLPDVSFDETLLSCLDKKTYGKQPGHAQFYYPKQYGYGEVWLRMAKNISSKIYYNAAVSDIDITKHLITTHDGLQIKADYIITTIPWTSFSVSGVPKENEDILVDIQKLKHTGVEIAYFSQNQNCSAHWIYVPDEKCSYHRILLRHTFCPNSRGYWTETNIDRLENNEKEYSHINEYAYPVNTVNKPMIMKKLLRYMEKRNIYGLGRWGEHEHYNSDVVVERALRLAEMLNQC